MYLPDAVVSGKAHDEAVAGFCESGVKIAERLVQEGKYAEAEAICREIASDLYDPHCRPAALLLAKLQEPGHINKTMGPKFIAEGGGSAQTLIDAEGYYNSGRYDLAFKKYEQMLNLDPYNVAARRGQEQIDNRRRITARKLITKREPGSFGRFRKVGKNRSASMGKPAPMIGRLPKMPPARRESRTNSTRSSFRKSNFAMRVFAKRSILFGNKRRRTIPRPKAVEVSILFCD